MMCLHVDFLGFICLECTKHLESLKLCLLANVGNFQPSPIQIVFSITLSDFPLGCQWHKYWTFWDCPTGTCGSIYLLISIVFFPLPLSPLIPPSPLQSPHCCPWILFPFFSMPPPYFPTFAVILLSIYEFVSILLVSSACSLDST